MKKKQCYNLRYVSYTNNKVYVNTKPGFTNPIVAEMTFNITRLFEPYVTIVCVMAYRSHGQYIDGEYFKWRPLIRSRSAEEEKC